MLGIEYCHSAYIEQSKKVLYDYHRDYHALQIGFKIEGHENVNST